ncbi:MAG TPA: hypothetical protein VIN40_04795 [Candidatus Tyrphobacter sp.]
MLPALHDRERAVLFRWALLIAGAACALAPLNGAPSSSGVRTAAPSGAWESPGLPRLRFPEVRVGRDPFVPQASDLPANAVVRAVILGDSPHALIEIGSRTMLVGIGDVLAGARVSAIDDSGVVLSDGSRVPLHGEVP